MSLALIVVSKSPIAIAAGQSVFARLSGSFGGASPID